MLSSWVVITVVLVFCYLRSFSDPTDDEVTRD